MRSTTRPRRTDPRGPAQPHVREGRAGQFGLVAATASLAFACLAGTPADDLAGPADLAVPSAASWQRLALNALLVPLLEPDGEVAWAQPNEMQPCRESAEVRVDGRPVPHGQRLPIGQPVVVRFHLADCWPLGMSWMGLWGTLDMTVLHRGTELTATVRPVDLSAAIDGVRVPLRAGFSGVVSLAPAASRP